MTQRKELDLQTDIKNSVRKDSGYCIKMSNRFTIGIPDLLIALPPFAPCLVEVKDLGVVKRGFKRKIDVTPKQALELKRITEPYEYGEHLSCLFVGFKFEEDVKSHYRLVGLHHGERELCATNLKNLIWVPREVGSYYNVNHLLEGLNMARIR